MSTDGGSYKWINKITDKISFRNEVYGASKSRKYVDGKSTLVQEIDRQDFGGKDILIIDDICVYGGTFVGLAQMLKERNCGKLYLAVSHLTVVNPSPLLFMLFDKVFTTNSKGFEYVNGEGQQPSNLFIIS
jgi:ribose-phosphate pyrophosphokinase